jgi:hypothetical protein
MVIGNFWVVLPGYFNDVGAAPGPTAEHQIRLLAYTNVGPSCDALTTFGGEEGPIFSLENSDIAYNAGDVPHTHRMDLSPADTVVYLPFVTATDPNTFAVTASEIRAYDTTGSGTPLWHSTPFPVEIQRALPFANGTKIAAVADKQVWFLNADGTAINPGKPISAHGSYVVLKAEMGPRQELYLLTGPVPANPNVLPASEVITLRTPEEGALVRYQVGSGTVMIRADDGGQPWLQVNGLLARMLSADQYTALRNR